MVIGSLINISCTLYSGVQRFRNPTYSRIFWNISGYYLKKNWSYKGNILGMKFLPLYTSENTKYVGKKLENKDNYKLFTLIYIPMIFD